MQGSLSDTLLIETLDESYDLMRFFKAAPLIGGNVSRVNTRFAFEMEEPEFVARSIEAETLGGVEEEGKIERELVEL